MKIIGVTVGTTTPKPNFDQTDPRRGDFIKGDRSFLNMDDTLTEIGRPADAKATGDAIGKVQTNIDELSRLVEEHDHDDKYYTENEIDELLLEKAEKDHDHDDKYYTENEISGIIASIDEDIKKKADEVHDHDDKYYTESEVDELLSGKANSEHNHDDMYYTEIEIDGIVAGIDEAMKKKADSEHNHDDKYYTESEINGILLEKADKEHDHDDKYYTIDNINGILQDKANVDHNHNDTYYTTDEIDDMMVNIDEAMILKADSDHDHDDKYYTISDMDDILSDINDVIVDKADGVHNHTTDEVGIYFSAEEPLDAPDGSLWIDIDDVDEDDTPQIELDTTLTQEGMAADAKAVGEAIDAIPVTIDDDGYAEICGLRRVIGLSMVKVNDTITVTMGLEGNQTNISTIALDANGYPISVTADGVTCRVSWEGFDE